MSLSDEQLMLLEQFTYMNDDVFRAAGLDEKTVFKVPNVNELINSFTDDRLEQLRGTPDLANCGAVPDVLNENGDTTHITGSEWAAIITAIKNDPELMNMDIRFTTSIEDDSAGYNVDAMTFVPHNSKEGAVVCFRGTLNGEEWMDDAEYLAAIETDCNAKALMYINQLPYNNISVVGHSKGANKAVYVYYESDKVTNCIAMDCPGVSPEYYRSRADIVSNKKGTLKCYSLEGDYVNILMMPVPNAEYIYCKGSGVANFAENHCPNCFFNQKVDREDTTKITIDGISIGKQTDSMKSLNEFTCFVAIEMPYGERVQLAGYIGNILQVALKECDFKGDKEGSKIKLKSAILSDENQFAKTVAYFLKYSDLYGFDGKSFEGLLKELGADFMFDKTAFNFLTKQFKDGTEDPIVSNLIAGKLEDMLGIDKETALRIYRQIEAYYMSLDSIEKKPELSYDNFAGRLYNYSQDAYNTIISAIDEFQSIYFDTTTIFNYYAGEEWYTDVYADLACSSLGKFYREVPSLNNNCKLQIETTFKNEWDVDNRYSGLLEEYQTDFTSFRNKIIKLRDRLA